jgi:two-component system cell cycle response regulator CpdR
MAKAILLIDDDPHILETAQDILEAAGYEIQTGETGAAALEKLRARSFQLMIVDFNLLDVTGIELAVKAKAIHPDMAIILMTGEAAVDLGPAKNLIGAVLTKPVNPAELIKLIHQTI